MLWLILGAATLFFLMGGARAFERASIRSIKSLLAWVAALGGLSLALMLILTGRGGIAVSALLLFGPLLWQKWKGSQLPGSGPMPGRGSASGSGSEQGSGPFSGFGRTSPRHGMSREEALEILGLRPNATGTDIREAHRRLMRGAHPDTGGSDWLATRINQARDVLLRAR